MSRWLVAINEKAGSRSTNPARVASVLQNLGVEFDLVVPASAEEMTSVLANAARDNVGHVAVAGGDGTVNLAVNAFLGAGATETPVLGILPVGTGCDLLRTFGISQELPEAAKHLTTDTTFDCDIVTLEGEWGTRYFINVAQAGVGAAAAETAPRFSRTFGSARYPLAFGVRLPRFPHASVHVATDRRTVESRALAVIIANAQFFAGGWNVAPKANLVDGLVDIQIIDAEKREAPALVPKVIRGTHLKEHAVRRFTASEFSITTSPTWPVEADGDLVGNTAVSGRVVPAAIRLNI